MKIRLTSRISVCLIFVLLVNILANFYHPQLAQAATFVEAFNSNDFKATAGTTADWDLDNVSGHLLNGYYVRADDSEGYESVSTTGIVNPQVFSGDDGQPIIFYSSSGHVYAQKWSATLSSWLSLDEIDQESFVTFINTVDGFKVIKLNNGKYGIIANILIQGTPSPLITNLYYTQWTPNAGATVCGAGYISCFTNAAGTIAGPEIISNQGLAYNTYTLMDSNTTPNYNLVKDNHGNPSTMWVEKEGTSTNYYFVRWNGSAWTHADRTTSGKEKVVTRAALVSSKINFISIGEEFAAIINVGLTTYVMKWTGTAWQDLSGNNLSLPASYTSLTKYKGGISIIDLKIDRNGQLIAGAGSFDSGEGIYIARWQTSDNKWHYLDGTAIDNIDTMTTLFSGNSLGYWGFSVDKSNNVLVWMINGRLAASELYFSQWKGSSWVKADGVTSGYEAISNVTSGVFLHNSSQYVLDNNQYPIFMFNQFNGSSPTSLFLSRFTGRSIKGGNKVTNNQDTAIPTTSWYFGAYFDSVNEDVLIASQSLSSSSLNFVKFKEHIYPVDDQYLQSTTIAVPHNNDSNISRATLAANFNVPTDTTLTFQMSANGGTNWETVTSGVEKVFANPGTDLRWRALLNTIDVYKSATIQYLTIDVNAKVANASGDVQITASVDPELSITIPIASCDFTTFSSEKIKTCHYSTIVNTNSVNGYIGYIEANGAMRTSTNVSLANTGSGIGPNNDKIDVGYEEYGIATNDLDTVSVTAKVADCAALNDGTTAVPAVALDAKKSYALANGPVVNDEVVLCHITAISGQTPAGSYGQVITITVVSNF